MTTTFAGTRKAEAMRAARRKRDAARMRHAETQARLAKRNAKLYHKPEPLVAEQALPDSRAARASANKSKPPKATASTTNMPPRMAARKQSVAERKHELEHSPQRLQKENARLNALIVKLTKSGDNVTPKQRYFDENWLAARWGMSVKHIRNLRSAGVGPLVTYFGRSVRYRLRDVVAFEKGNAFASRTAKEQAKKS
jgi:hypothetical protein